MGEELERRTLFTAVVRDWESGGTAVMPDASLGLEGYLDWIHEEFRDRLQLSIVSPCFFFAFCSILLTASTDT